MICFFWTVLGFFCFGCELEIASFLVDTERFEECEDDEEADEDDKEEEDDAGMNNVPSSSTLTFLLLLTW